RVAVEHVPNPGIFVGVVVDNLAQGQPPVGPAGGKAGRHLHRPLVVRICATTSFRAWSASTKTSGSLNRDFSLIADQITEACDGAGSMSGGYSGDPNGASGG